MDGELNAFVALMQIRAEAPTLCSDIKFSVQYMRVLTYQILVKQVAQYVTREKHVHMALEAKE